MNNMDRLWRNDVIATFKMVWLRGLELCSVGNLDIRGANLHGMGSILKELRLFSGHFKRMAPN